MLSSFLKVNDLTTCGPRRESKTGSKAFLPKLIVLFSLLVCALCSGITNSEAFYKYLLILVAETMKMNLKDISRKKSK